MNNVSLLQKTSIRHKPDKKCSSPPPFTISLRLFCCCKMFCRVFFELFFFFPFLPSGMAALSLGLIKSANGLGGGAGPGEGFNPVRALSRFLKQQKCVITEFTYNFPMNNSKLHIVMIIWEHLQVISLRQERAMFVVVFVFPSVAGLFNK